MLHFIDSAFIKNGSGRNLYISLLYWPLFDPVRNEPRFKFIMDSLNRFYKPYQVKYRNVKWKENK